MEAGACLIFSQFLKILPFTSSHRVYFPLEGSMTKKTNFRLTDDDLTQMDELVRLLAERDGRPSNRADALRWAISQAILKFPKFPKKIASLG
jgi:hypothetical protein